MSKGTIRPGRAYVTAGYSEAGADQSAARLLRNAQITTRIAELRAAVEQPSRERAIEKAAVDKAWVLTELVEIVKMGKAAEPVLDADGNETGVVRQNLAAANKALELVGKELGMFVDRKEVRRGPLDGLPPEDLEALENALTRILGRGAGEPAAASTAPAAG